MPLKKSSGNMYPWVTHMHSHLVGRCPHECIYCYVQAMAARFKEVAARYSGPVELIEDELRVAYGTGRTIFIEHMGDLFAKDVPSAFIVRILAHCAAWPRNTYVFQTKNPRRYLAYIDEIPAGSLLGTTIETNRDLPGVSKAPEPFERFDAMTLIPLPKFRTFVTVEPILKFDRARLRRWLSIIGPEFVNIGADSKSHGLPEPTAAEVAALIAALKKCGIEVREKHNLQRLIESL
jgi:DNA repair photolyase